jgi:hypothetical protein
MNGYREISIRDIPGTMKNMKGLKKNPDIRYAMTLFTIFMLDLLFIPSDLWEPQSR